VTEKREQGNGGTVEKGETEREVSLVDGALLESSDGDLAVSKVKLSSNMVSMGSRYEVVVLDGNVVIPLMSCEVWCECAQERMR